MRPHFTAPHVFVSHKMEPEFHDWLHGLAERLGLPLSQTFDLALERLAQESEYPPPPLRLPLRRRRTIAAR